MGMVALTGGEAEPVPTIEEEGPKEEDTLTELEEEGDIVAVLEGEEDAVPLAVGDWVTAAEAVPQLDVVADWERVPLTVFVRKGVGEDDTVKVIDLDCTPALALPGKDRRAVRVGALVTLPEDEEETKEVGVPQAPVPEGEDENVTQAVCELELVPVTVEVDDGVRVANVAVVDVVEEAEGEDVEVREALGELVPLRVAIEGEVLGEPLPLRLAIVAELQGELDTLKLVDSDALLRGDAETDRVKVAAIDPDSSGVGEGVLLEVPVPDHATPLEEGRLVRVGVVEGDLARERDFAADGDVEAEDVGLAVTLPVAEEDGQDDEEGVFVSVGVEVAD